MHPTIDPAQISERLGIQPTRTMRYGSPVTTPAGTISANTYRETKWSLELENLEHLDLGELAQRAIAGLPVSSPFWAELEQAGGRASLTFSVVGTKYQGAAISAENVRKLARMGMRFGIEVYAVPQS